jgi:Pro-kumamolisin, activation domain
MRRKVVVLIALLTLVQVSMTQERLGDRITDVIDERKRTVLQGHLNPAAKPQADRGRVDRQLTLPRVMMVFKRTEEQQANLDAFLKEQQDPSSRNYQLWLTPEEFASRFGLSPADLNKVVSWVQDR